MAQKAMTYRTFLRTCKSFEEFAKAEKVEQDTGLTITEARAQCDEYNNNRTDEEKEAGTKMEFERE
jgi:hypothetical protein